MKERLVVAALSISAAAFVGVLTREGYTERAVIPVAGDVPTVGFGTTQGVTMDSVTTPVRAAQRALEDMRAYEGAIKQCVTAPLHQAEYDVWADFAYNVGPNAFCASSIVRDINARQYARACERILDWKYVRGYDCSTPGNRVCAGLWRDRLRSHAQCRAAQ